MQLPERSFYDSTYDKIVTWGLWVIIGGGVFWLVRQRWVSMPWKIVVVVGLGAALLLYRWLE